MAFSKSFLSLFNRPASSLTKKKKLSRLQHAIEELENRLVPTSATWTGLTGALWSNSASWSGAPAIVPGTGDTATFSGPGTITASLTTPVTIGSIVFDTINAGAFTIGSGAVNSQSLTLDNGGAITVNSGVVNNQLFNTANILGNDGTTQNFTLTNNSTAGLTLAGTITGSTGAGVKSLILAGSGRTFLSGIIANGTTGTVALTKNDAGTTTLSGANTYTGGTAINAGTIKIGSAAALGGNAGAVTLASGAVLDVNFAMTGTNPLALNGTGLGKGALINSSATAATYAGAITLGSASTVGGTNIGTLSLSGGVNTAGFNLTVSGPGQTSAGVVSGSGNLIINGPGMTTLNSANTFTGTVTVNGGGVQTNNVAAFGSNQGLGKQAANVASNLTLNGVLQVNTSSTVDRLFTVPANGNASIYSGAYASGASGGNPSASAVTYSNTGAVVFGGGAASTLTFGGFNGGNNTSAASLINSFAPTINDVDGTFKTNVSVIGAGIWQLNNANNTYSGTTKIAGGMLTTPTLSDGGINSGIGSSSNAASNLILSSGGTLRYTGAAQTTDRLFTVGQGGAQIDASGTGALTLSNSGSVAFNAQGAVPLILTGSSTAANTMITSIGDGGSGATSLIKNGFGTWVLSGSNSYTGGTAINGGVLQFESSNAVGGAAPNATTKNITLNSFATNNFTGSAPVAGATAVFNYNFSQADLNRLATASVGSLALASGAANSNALDFTGYSNLSLGAAGASAATYSGTLTPAASTYRLGGGGGTLNFNSSIASGSLVVGQPGSIGSSGTVVLGATNTFAGGIAINSGNTLAASATTTTPFGSTNAVTINKGTFQLNPDAASDLAQSIGVLTSTGDQSVVTINSANAGSVITTLNIDSLSLPTISTQNGTPISTGTTGAIIFNSGSTSSLARSVFNFTGTAPTIVNGMLAPTVIGQLSGTASKAGDFLTLSGTALALPTYTAVTATTNGGSNTTLYSATTGNVALGFPVAVHSLKVGTATNAYTVTSAAGKVLTIGDGTNPSGVILNSGSTLSGPVSLASNTLVYANGTTSLGNAVISGAGGLTLMGPGSYSSAPSGSSTYTGNTVIGSSVTWTGTGYTAGVPTIFGTEPSSPVSNSITLLDGASFIGAATSFTANRGILLAGGVITVGSNYGGNGAFTINGPISGYANNLIVAGNGGSSAGLVLNGTNTFVANSITLTPGASVVASTDASLGAVPTSFNPTAVVFNGGKLQLGSSTYNANRGFYLNATGGTLQTSNGITAIVPNVISGAGGLTISSNSNGGNSGITLSGANTYLGDTTISGGVVFISSNANLGDASGSLNLASPTLNIANTAATGFASSRAVNLYGNPTVAVTATAELTGPITGPFTLQARGGTGTYLVGNNNYAGLNINTGIVGIATAANLPVSTGAITNSATMQIVGSTPLAISQSVNQTGTATYHQLNSDQVVTVNGQVTGNGSLTATGGTLILTNTAANDFGGTAGTITLNGGGKLEGVIGSATSGSPFGVATNALALNNGTLQIDPATAGGSVANVSLGAISSITSGNTLAINYGPTSTVNTTLTVNSMATRSAGGAVTFNPGAGTLGTQSNFTFLASPTLVNSNTMLGAWAVARQTSSTDADFVKVPTAAPFTLGTATYNVTSIGTTATDIADVSATANLVTGSRAFAAKTSAELILAGTLTIGSGAGQGGLILNSGGSINGGTLAFGGAEGVIYTSGTSNIGTAANPTAITGSAGVTFHGPGTVTLNGTNSYTTATYLAGPGSVQVSSNAALGATAATVQLNGGTLILDTSAGAVSLPATRNATLNSTGGINVSSNLNAATFAGVISGSGTAFTKSGPGTLTLSGTNTYSGRTYINAGVLSVTTIANGGTNSNIGASNASPSSLILNGGSLQYASNAAAASTDRLFTLNADSTLDASGSGANTLTFANAGSVLVSTNANSTLTLTGSNTGNNTLTPSLTDSVAGSFTTSVLKSGSGTWVLNGASTYTGATTVSSGALVAGIDAAYNAPGPFGTSTSAITLGDAATTTDNSSPSLLIGGAFNVARPVTVANQATSGVYTVGGSNTSGIAQFSGNITLNQPVTLTAANGGVVDFNTGTWTTNDNIVNVTGAGTSIVKLSNTLGTAAAVNVNSGTFQVMGSITQSSGVTVASGAVLSGTGTIGSNVSTLAGGTLAPGVAAIGTLTVNVTGSDLTLAGISDFEINADTSANDKVVVNDLITYGGTLKITNLSGTLALGQSWDLFDGTRDGATVFANNAVFGTIGDGANLPFLPNTLAWQFNYATGVLSISSSLVSPTVTSVVPAIGPTTGGTLVIITGTNFVSISSVTIDGTPLATFTVSGTTQISITTPSHAAGAVDVVVTNAAGSGSLNGSSDFTYATPAVTSAQVNGGPSVVLGGSSWSLAGQNSVVKQILVTFNQAVTVASDAFTVTPVPVSLTPGPGVVIVGGGAAPSSAAVTASIAATLSPSSYLVTFSGPGTNAAGVINSGVYDLTTIASKVSANGETMATNQKTTFFAMFGTINANDSLTSGTIGDGFSNAFVDPGSLFQFSDAFGSNAATPVGPPAYNIVFDSNLDGFIDPGDLFAFSDSFGIDWDF